MGRPPGRRARGLPAGRPRPRPVRAGRRGGSGAARLNRDPEELGDADARPGKRPRRLLRRAVAVVGLAAVLVLGGAIAYFAIPQPTLPEAVAALASDAEVEFRNVDGDLEFAPVGHAPSVGLILYPGGKVDATAYAPTARAIAAHGFLVVITPMPLHLAVLDIDAATRVIERHLDVPTWAVGGHSLGGSMAAEYANRQPHAVDGLVLWAAYSAADLSAQPLRALVVYGSLDGGAARMGSIESLTKLPPPPTVRVIEGGNHEQMGWYTGQPNDPAAAISRADQQAQLVDLTVHFLEDLGPVVDEH